MQDEFNSTNIIFEEKNYPSRSRTETILSNLAHG